MPTQQSIAELQQQIAQLERELQKYRDQPDGNLKGTDAAVECRSDHILSALLDHSQDAITIRCCSDGRYIMANAKFCSDLDLPLQDILGKSSADLLPQDLANSNAENDEKVILLKKPVTMRWHIKGRHGEIDKIVNKFPIINDANEVVAIGNIVTDISQQVHAEQKWQESEELFRKTFYTSPDCINLNRLKDGLYIDINDGFTNVLGYTKEEILGKTAIDLGIWHHPDDRQRLIQCFTETGSVNNLEAEFVKKDGEVIVGLMSARLLKIANEDVIVSVTRDITERKRMEEALRESEHRFKDLADLLPEAIFETDENLNITYINRRAAELLGISNEVLVSRCCLNYFSENDRLPIRENLKRGMQGVKVEPTEYRLVRPDGSELPVMLSHSIIIKEGHFAGIRGAIFDLTDQKQAERERKVMEEQFLQSQKLEAIGRLAGGVAHDLNNMLSPILGYAELLLLELAPGDKRRHAAQEIINASQRARGLIHQLLAYGRKQTLEYHPVDLNVVLKNLQNLLRRSIREDIDFEIKFAPHCPAVKADIGQIEQVIMNLCVNAQDAMPDGGRLIIEIKLVELDRAYVNAHQDVHPGRYMQLSINDTGMGMDETTRRQIFEPFFSTKGEQGTGLGLATVYGIVKQHGGNIWVYSELGVGTTFKIHLPVSNDNKQVVNNESVPESDLLIKGTETILTVEDDNTILELVQTILKQFGYSVLIAHNGAEALSVLDQHRGRLDLLLTDVVMPDMNGKELYLKAIEKHQNLKVLFMSGYTDDTIAHRGILEEGIKFIQKPFTMKYLLMKIRETIDNT